jgi:glycosyltransferase involved in cell wall biosynthesis
MKNVMVLIPQLSGGGAERIAGYVSKYLSKNYNVYLVTLIDTEITYDYGGYYISLDSKIYTNIIMKSYNFISRIRKIKTLKKKLDIQISISFLNFPNVYNLLSRVKEKTITSFRSNQSMSNNTYFKKMIVKYILKKSDAVVSISQGVKSDLETNFHGDSQKIYTIYNFLATDLPESYTFKSSKNYSNNNFTFINIGSLRSVKGHMYLIKAFSIYVKKYPKANLIILGEGHLRSKLQDYINNLNLQNLVHLKGYVNNTSEYLRDADVMILTSLYEGLSNAILEALLHGNMVISTDCFSGPREILAPNTNHLKKTKEISFEEYGILVPTFHESDEESITNFKIDYLVKAMEISYLDGDLRKKYQEKGLTRSKDFDYEKIGAQWENLVEKILEDNYEK